MAELYGVLKGSIESVKMRLQHEALSRTRDGSTQMTTCIWRGDSQLAEMMGNLKSLCAVLSADFTKLVMVGTKAPSPDALGSLIGEIIPHIESFGTYYTECLLRQCSISPELFLLVSTEVLSFFSNMVEVTDALKSEQYDRARQVVGAVIEIADKHISKLPATNKVAIRRSVMEKIGGIGAIIEEFQAYVTKSQRAGAGAGAGDDGDDDDGDDDDDEGTYTPEELEVMALHMQLLEQSKAAVKACLSAMTEASDFLAPIISEREPQATASNGVNGEQVDTSATNSVFQQATAQGGTIDLCQSWVAHMVAQTKKIDEKVLDLGSDLYSPLEDEQQTNRKFTELKDHVQALIAMLKNGALVSNQQQQQEENRQYLSFRSMFREDTNDEIDTVSLQMISLILTRSHL